MSRLSTGYSCGCSESAIIDKKELVEGALARESFLDSMNLVLSSIFGPAFWANSRWLDENAEGGSVEKRQHGFTLIELMVTVSIIAILAAIAWPSYQQYVIRGKRSAAQAQMMDIANREQQYLLANRTYASKSQLEASGYALPSEVGRNYTYDVALGSEAMPTFTITFTAIGAQASDGNLILSSEGEKAPAGKW